MINLYNKAVFLILLITLVSSLKSYEPYFTSALPYQAHSFNDLDYFVNLFKKGTTYYKIDISLADRQSCQKYSSWNLTKNSQPPCRYYDQYSYQICCLGLRGDASSQPKFLQPFNTSSDFVSMVKNKLLGPQIFKDRKLFVAMNFQFKFYFDSGIIQGFINKLTQLMKQFQGRLDIGLGNYILDYDWMCMRNFTNLQDQNSVQKENYELQDQIKCTTQRLRASKTPYFLQSSSMNPYHEKDIYKRFRNFNTFFRDAEKFCKQGFPKWIANYPQYPLIFWEPSNQNQIQWIFQTLMSQKCIQKHGRSIQGIAIASNLDPQMFQHYMLKAKINSNPNINNSEWNFQQQKLFLNYSKKISIGSNGKYIFAGYVENDGKYYINVHQKKLQKSFSIQKIRIAEQQQDIKGEVNQIFALQNTFGIVIGQVRQANLEARSQTILLYDIEQQPFKLKYNTLLTITNHISTLMIQNQNQEKVVYILRLNVDEIYSIFSYNVDQKSSSVWTTFTNQNFQITDFQVFRYKDEQMMIFVGDNGTIMYYSLFSMKSKAFIEKGIKLTNGAKPKIGYNQKDQVITFVMQNSMCQSLILANNNQINKCLIPKNPLYKNLTNIPSVVNKVTISVEDMMNINKNYSFPVTACTQSGNLYKSPNMAKIFQGKNSDIIYFAQDNQMYIISQYVAINQQGLFNGIFCGGSNYQSYGKGYYLFKLKSL